MIGNCQAGWAVMLVAALRPELFGPIIVAGAPLAYWAGVHGQYPMRYSGGLLGGSWLTALAGDLGAGIFDGAALVQNFENQNPANTLWSKQYNLWSKIDTGGRERRDVALVNASEVAAARGDRPLRRRRRQDQESRRTAAAARVAQVGRAGPSMGIDAVELGGLPRKRKTSQPYGWTPKLASNGTPVHTDYSLKQH